MMKAFHDGPHTVLTFTMQVAMDRPCSPPPHYVLFNRRVARMGTGGRLKHFHWHRIIADEFHELIGAAVDGQHPFNEAKHQLTEP